MSDHGYARQARPSSGAPMRSDPWARGVPAAASTSTSFPVRVLAIRTSNTIVAAMTPRVVSQGQRVADLGKASYGKRDYTRRRSVSASALEVSTPPPWMRGDEWERLVSIGGTPAAAPQVSRSSCAQLTEVGAGRIGAPPPGSPLGSAVQPPILERTVARPTIPPVAPARPTIPPVPSARPGIPRQAGPLIRRTLPPAAGWLSPPPWVSRRDAELVASGPLPTADSLADPIRRGSEASAQAEPGAESVVAAPSAHTATDTAPAPASRTIVVAEGTPVLKPAECSDGHTNPEGPTTQSVLAIRRCGQPSGSATTAPAPRRRTSTGRGGTWRSTATATPWRWGHRRSRLS